MSTYESEENSSIGARLKVERVRLKLSQVELGELFGVDRKVIRWYEENKTSPRADQLLSLWNRGGDLLYIVAGVHMPLLAMQRQAPYTAAQRLASEVITLNLSETDAEMLMALAVRLANK